MKQFSALFFVAVFLIGVLALGGCASGGFALMHSAQWVGQRLLPGAAADGLPPHPDPRFRYLRVEMTGGAPAMLVLAFVDPHPLGDIEVWYSAQGEVLQLQNGRIVATQGLALDWAAVRFTVAPPAWTAVAPNGAVFRREHDELPHYRYGVREDLRVTVVNQPPASVLRALVPAAPSVRYAWFQETATPIDGAGAPVTSVTTVTSWYAWGLHLGQPTVVFSEQCLAPDVCLRMQRWPVQEAVL